MSEDMDVLCKVIKHANTCFLNHNNWSLKSLCSQWNIPCINLYDHNKDMFYNSQYSVVQMTATKKCFYFITYYHNFKVFFSNQHQSKSAFPTSKLTLLLCERMLNSDHLSNVLPSFCKYWYHKTNLLLKAKWESYDSIKGVHHFFLIWLHLKSQLVPSWASFMSCASGMCPLTLIMESIGSFSEVKLDIGIWLSLGCQW